MNKEFQRIAERMVSESISAGKTKSYVSVLRTVTQRLYRYLETEGLQFTPENASKWLSTAVRPYISYEAFMQKRVHVFRIASELYPERNLMPLFYDKDKLSAYEILPLWAQRLIDEYISEKSKVLRLTCHLRNHAALFMKELLDLGFDETGTVTCLMAATAYLRNSNNDYTIGYIRFLKNKGMTAEYAEASYSPVLAERTVHYSKTELQNTAAGYALKDYKKAFDILISEMKNTGYSRSMIQSTSSHLDEFGIFCETIDIPVSEETVEAFLDMQERVFKLNTHSKSRALRLVLDILAGRKNNMFMHIFRKTKHGFPSWTAECIEDYELTRRKYSRLSPSSLRMDRTSLLRFLNYMDSYGVTSFKGITLQHITQFILDDLHNTPEGKAAYNVRIKAFLSFLHEHGLTEKDLSKAIPTVSTVKVKPVETLTEEQQQQVLKYCADPSVSCRDKAILKIGMQTGLRAGDIINLRFDSVDWDRQLFRIVQQKTYSEILVPFSSGAGNALFEYITTERPRIRSEFIFINTKAPFSHSHSSVARRILSKALEERKGFHIVRKTFASKLASQRTSFTMVSEVLGHSGTDSVDAYISADRQSLKQCAIPMSTMFSYRGNLI